MLAAIGVLVLLLVCLIVGCLWLTIPGANLSTHIPGLAGPVAITFDTDMVPRIQATADLDAAAALGFVHARDRMFQMELTRRAASGRLSEIAGPATLRIDRMMRTLGLRQHAVADLATLPPEARAMLEAYARGVNAWITLKGRFAAPEFLVLGRPEPWQPADSLLWAKTMGLWLSMNWRQELARQALEGKLAPALLNQLWPPQADIPGPSAKADSPGSSAKAGIPGSLAHADVPSPSPQADIPAASATTQPGFASAAARLAAVLPHFPGPYTMPPSASNEWAVDGRHTASGAPLLAGDPHLAFGFPGIWYLARINTPGRVLAGATAPGVPFLVLGHNGKIAWTFTTTGADVQDIFIETPAGDGTYQTPDGPLPFTVREERIGIRGQPDQLITVRETRHGPVISDLDDPNGPILAVAMGNLQPGDTAAAGLLALNRAETVQQAGVAARQITSPVQNMVVADSKTIALFLTGRVPIRKAGDGAAPVPGDGSHDWTGWASGEQLPHSVAPESGRLVNANEPVAGPDFPVFMGRDTFGDWRAQRIRQMLAEYDKHTPADFARMQVDFVNLFARQVLPVLLATPDVSGPSQTALALLKGWDGAAARDLPQPLIFNAWMDDFYHAVLRQAGIASGLGAPVSDFVSYVLSPAGEHWCGQGCGPLLRDSLATALTDLRARFGDDMYAWRWGAAHQATFAHPLLRNIPVLDRLSTIRIPSGGDDDTVGRGGMDARLQSVHGAAYRGVYDLSDLDRSLFMITPGQSGNLLSVHARDFVTRWRDGATITLGPVAAKVTGTIQLTP